MSCSRRRHHHERLFENLFPARCPTSIATRAAHRCLFLTVRTDEPCAATLRRATRAIPSARFMSQGGAALAPDASTTISTRRFC